MSSLVFGGDTMLRLCYGMSRYSVDMDFYFSAGSFGKKKTQHGIYFKQLQKVIQEEYTVTDSQNKFNTLLIEIKHAQYDRKLKIKINKQTIFKQLKPVIAFSPYSTRQVLVNTATLEQMMKNKIAALLDRKEIRDAFDIEFLIRRKVKPSATVIEIKQVLENLQKFTKNDFNVKLGSLLPAEIREHYKENRFSYLEHYLQRLADGK